MALYNPITDTNGIHESYCRCKDRQCEDRTKGNLAYRREFEQALGLPTNDLDRATGADLSELREANRRPAKVVEAHVCADTGTPASQDSVERWEKTFAHLTTVKDQWRYRWPSKEESLEESAQPDSTLDSTARNLHARRRKNL